jgi:hypothetical protein
MKISAKIYYGATIIWLAFLQKNSSIKMEERFLTLKTTNMKNVDIVNKRLITVSGLLWANIYCRAISSTCCMVFT